MSDLVNKIQEDINSYKIELGVIENCIKTNLNTVQNKFRGKNLKTIEDTRYMLAKARDDIGFIRMFNLLNKNINAVLKENIELLEIDFDQLDYVPYNILERELGLIEQYCQIDILEHINDFGSIYEKINLSIDFDDIINNFAIKVEEYTNIYIKHINKYLEDQEKNIKKFKLAQSF